MRLGSRSVVVIPTYDEAENLPLLAECILEMPERLDLLVVDDASPDGTGETAEKLRRETGGRVEVIHRPGKLGLGTAYVEGFQWAISAGYDRIAQMDADFSHDPGVLPSLLGALDAADLAIGSRYVPGGGTRNWGVLRRLISRAGSQYARWVLSLRVRDLTGGFKAWRQETLSAMELTRVRSGGYCFQVETTYRAYRLGARITEIPITFTDRRVGQSKMSRAIVLEAAWRIPLLRLGVGI